MQIPKEAMILMKGIGMGLIYWCGGVMALFGIACLCSKRLRDWAEGKEPQKEWKRGGWYVGKIKIRHETDDAKEW